MFEKKLQALQEKWKLKMGVQKQAEARKDVLKAVTMTRKRNRRMLKKSKLGGFKKMNFKWETKRGQEGASYTAMLLLRGAKQKESENKEGSI